MNEADELIVLGIIGTVILLIIGYAGGYLWKKNGLNIFKCNRYTLIHWFN